VRPPLPLPAGGVYCFHRERGWGCVLYMTLGEQVMAWADEFTRSPRLMPDPRGWRESLWESRSGRAALWWEPSLGRR
jgi:hypothetical protein